MLKLGFQIFFQGIFTICDYCQQIETQKAIARKTAQQAMEVDPNADSDLVEASGTVTIFYMFVTNPEQAMNKSV